MYTMIDGVWPTMITPFTEKNTIDYHALEQMVEWYIQKKSDGLFAVCQSSEMFFLSEKERYEIASFVKKTAGDRIPVIASGHISSTIDKQIEELKMMASTGIDALVLITNAMAGENENDDVWKKNTEKIISQVPDIPLGLYECPYPYKRLIKPDILKWCADTGRFFFLKDTSCKIEDIKAKIDAVKKTPLKLFNANSATLLESLRAGAFGYSGIMGNIHPDIYAWLCDNWMESNEKSEEIQAFLGVTSVFERQLYPLNAKYYQQMEGIDINLISRSHRGSYLTESNKKELMYLRYMTKKFTSLAKLF